MQDGTIFHRLNFIYKHLILQGDGMKLLVIGNGGREHALAWKLAQSSKVETVFVAPGNAGTAIEPKLQNIALTAHQDLIDFCRNENIAFTVVGPEAPLAAGVVNDFRAAGLRFLADSIRGSVGEFKRFC